MGVVIKWRMAILTLNVTAIFLARNITLLLLSLLYNYSYYYLIYSSLF